MKQWKIHEAKAKLSELVKEGQNEPQIILNREKKLGVFINYDYFLELLEAKKKSEEKSLVEIIEEIRSIPAKESFPEIKRTNRKTWVD